MCFCLGCLAEFLWDFCFTGWFLMDLPVSLETDGFDII